MRIGALWLLLSCVRPGPACTVIQDSSNVSITRGPWISVHDVDVPHSHQQKNLRLRFSGRQGPLLRPPQVVQHPAPTRQFEAGPAWRLARPDLARAARLLPVANAFGK